MVKWHALICHGASIDARGGARERLSVRALSLRGLTPVGNRLRRLIFPLPVPVDGVSRARWEAEISSGAVHRESPRLHHMRVTAPKHAAASGADAGVWPGRTQDVPRTETASCQHKAEETSGRCPTVTAERVMLWVCFSLFIIWKSESCQERVEEC